MGIDTNLLKAFAKQGFKALITILLLTGLGVFTNWILLAFLTPELKTLFDASGARGGHGGGAAAILVVILMLVMNWQASLLFLAFFFVFPILHFLFAKKYAVTSAITSLLGERKTQFVEYLLQKFFERMNSKMESLDKLNSSGVVTTVNEYLPVYLKKLEGMPFLIKGMVKFFLSRFDFMGIVSGVINEEGKMDISQEEVIHKISSKVNVVLDEKVFTPSFQANWILYSINILIFIAVKTIV
jgi:hypothetical protein